MKKILLAVCAVALGLTGAQAETRTYQLFDHVTYYDGYLVSNIPEDAPEEGVHRLYTYLTTRQIPEEVLNSLGEQLSIDVTIHAMCDNYDRQGHVNLALVPKGAADYTVKYDETDPMRIELGRFITPFMNKNKEPKSVPYHFDLAYLSQILRDPALREAYDFWLELEVFGVPYAAQQQVEGCAGCNEVFQGSLTLSTEGEVLSEATANVLVPIEMYTCEWRSDRGMTNYTETGTDELGACIKTWTFDVPADLTDARMVLVMSNHGANAGGEEYNRRRHLIYFDGNHIETFRPGGVSCEPYRQYNTQGNGIYGSSERSESEWRSFSNWCPGSVIETRYFELGALPAGEHSFTIDVPQAQFVNNEGFFPVSIHLVGVTEGNLTQENGIASVEDDADYVSAIITDGGHLRVTAPSPVTLLELYTMDGSMAGYSTSASLRVDTVPAGVYLLGVTLSDGTREMHKLAL